MVKRTKADANHEVWSKAVGAKLGTVKTVGTVGPALQSLQDILMGLILYQSKQFNQHQRKLLFCSRDDNDSQTYQRKEAESFLLLSPAKHKD